ncbi:reduced folate transporter isoform X2 [Sorex araneus]|uniref:reduced folate transporter isoform X2 n=1 Tax=Sorex araneus TaxID=42254 RepID=UPI002433B2DC|nr:reduced folate transporter isoform X2 [Sorex araneus]
MTHSDGAEPHPSSLPPGGPASMSASEEQKQVPAEPGPAGGQRAWRCLVGYLCLYGFMAQLRPGESFITPYLLGLDKNFTKTQVTNEITPVLSYSYLAVLVPVFLVTDLVRYTPVLVLQALSFVCVWLLLLFGRSVLHMQLMEFFYALTMAARIAYSSYIFSLVPPARYQRMAGYSRAAVLLGVFTSSVLGQLLVTAAKLSLSTLNQLSLGLLVFSLGLSVFLRRPKRSLFFHRRAAPAEGATPAELCHMKPGQGQPGGRRAAWRDWTLVCMLQELAVSARRPQLQLWSFWWVFSSAGYYLVVYYVHILWSEVDANVNYNGGADAASTLLGAITSFAAGFLKLRWALWGKLVIACVTAAQAGLVFLMYNSASIWPCYTAFVLFRGAYQFLVPIATFQIASSLSKELCALVFGINTFLATVLKTIITLIVSDKSSLGLPVRKQFQVYFAYFLVLSAIYLLAALVGGLSLCTQKRHLPLPQAHEMQSPTEKATTGTWGSGNRASHPSGPEQPPDVCCTTVSCPEPGPDTQPGPQCGRTGVLPWLRLNSNSHVQTRSVMWRPR